MKAEKDMSKDFAAGRTKSATEGEAAEGILKETPLGTGLVVAIGKEGSIGKGEV